jgi:hypothetical protein
MMIDAFYSAASLALTRSTVPMPQPAALAVALVPAPFSSAFRMMASIAASILGLPNGLPVLVPCFLAQVVGVRVEQDAGG